MYVRALKKRKELFENDKLAIFIGKQCLKVMKRIARDYARQSTWTGRLPEGYEDAFDYEISYIPRKWQN